MPDVPITWVKSVFKWKDAGWDGERMIRRDLVPGSAHWTLNMHDEISSFDFVCPCGCGAVAALPVNQNPRNPGWTWDQNQEKPTLSPSIQMTSPCRWHGWMKTGIFTSV
jgi:hypothetical protein